MRGKSPQNFTILSLTIAGFVLCSLRGSIIILETELLFLGAFPLTPIKQTSAFDFVYHPTPKKGLPFLGFVFTHVKPTVLYSKPHALIVFNAS